MCTHTPGSAAPACTSPTHTHPWVCSPPTVCTHTPCTPLGLQPHTDTALQSLQFLVYVCKSVYKHAPPPSTAPPRDCSCSMHTYVHMHTHPCTPPLQRGTAAPTAGTRAPCRHCSPTAHPQPPRAAAPPCTRVHTHIHAHTHGAHGVVAPGTRRARAGDAQGTRGGRASLQSRVHKAGGRGTRGLPLHPTPRSPPRFAGSPSAVVTGPRWRCQQGKPLRSPRCVVPSPANKPPLPAARTRPATLAHACPPGRGVPGGRSPLRQAHVPAGRPPAHGSAAGPPRREAAGAKNGAGLTCQRHVTPQPARWGWRGLPAPQDEEEEEGSAHSHGPAPTPTSAVPRSPWPPCPLQVGGPTSPSSCVLGRLNTGPWRRGKGSGIPSLCWWGGGSLGAKEAPWTPVLPLPSPPCGSSGAVARQREHKHQHMRFMGPQPGGVRVRGPALPQPHPAGGGHRGPPTCLGCSPCGGFPRPLSMVNTLGSPLCPAPPYPSIPLISGSLHSPGVPAPPDAAHLHPPGTLHPPWVPVSLNPPGVHSPLNPAPPQI